MGMFNLKMLVDFNVSYEHRKLYADAFMQNIGFKLMGQGRHRRTYLHDSKKYVIKVPISIYGLEANKREHEIYRKHFNKPSTNGVVYGPCRLIQQNLLLMWAVEATFGGGTDGETQAIRNKLLRKANKNMPDWVSYIDSSQCGILPGGKVVAFDYG